MKLPLANDVLTRRSRKIRKKLLGHGHLNTWVTYNTGSMKGKGYVGEGCLIKCGSGWKGRADGGMREEITNTKDI